MKTRVFNYFQETADFVAYVAKDATNKRACHVIECGGGVAQEVIMTIGKRTATVDISHMQRPL